MYSLPILMFVLLIDNWNQYLFYDFNIHDFSQKVHERWLEIKEHISDTLIINIIMQNVVAFTKLKVL